MSGSSSKRRMAENEAVFREFNERIENGIEKVKRLAKKEGQEDLIKHSDTPLYFYCECSDENCTKRVLLKPSQYKKIHKHRDRFVIVAGHETETIEQIIEKEADFYVVEKFDVPSKPKGGPKKTNVDNT